MSAPTYTGLFPLSAADAYGAIFKKRVGRGAGARDNEFAIPTLIVTYAIDCELGGSYIGSTDNFYRRWHSHYRRLRCGLHQNADLQAIYDKHGAEVFRIRILSVYEDTEGLFDREVEDGLAYVPQTEMLNRRLGHRWINGWSPFTGEVRHSAPRRNRHGSSPRRQIRSRS